MQRHFSNRGEALAEVAAVKTMTHRMPLAKSVFPSQRGRGVTPGPWKARVREAIFPESSPRKGESKDSGKSVVAPLEF